jgi:predicted naringenin-chalcone synthase
MCPNEYETLRWPTNLDRAGIEKRLIQVRDSGVPELASRFTGVEKMTSAQLGAAVVAALSWVQGKPEHRALATQLEMCAMNLKNLKQSG